MGRGLFGFRTWNWRQEEQFQSGATEIWVTHIQTQKHLALQDATWLKLKKGKNIACSSSRCVLNDTVLLPVKPLVLSFIHSQWQVMARVYASFRSLKHSSPLLSHLPILPQESCSVWLPRKGNQKKHQIFHFFFLCSLNIFL